MEYNLERFLSAHEYSYEQALAEIKSGYKRSHWMWYIFPQIDGLGFSSTAQYYAIKNLEEAKAYLNHPVLRTHLLEISEALLCHTDKSAPQILGGIDAMKLHSCMTLFHIVEPENRVFTQVIQQFFNNQLDQNTIRILKSPN